MNLQNISELHVLGKNTFKEMVTFCVVEKVGLLWGWYMCRATFGKPETMIWLCFPDASEAHSARGAVGMPQGFLFAWLVTHPILILLHQSKNEVFNDFFFKSSCSSPFVFMDGASPVIPPQPDSWWKFNNPFPQLPRTLSPPHKVHDSWVSSAPC